MESWAESSLAGDAVCGAAAIDPSALVGLRSSSAASDAAPSHDREYRTSEEYAHWLGNPPPNAAINHQPADQQQSYQQQRLHTSFTPVFPAGPLSATSYESADEHDWLPDMRYQMQEVIPSIYLGPYNSSKRNQFDRLKAVGITHIVCVRNPLEANIVKPHFADAFRYLVLDVADSQFQNIISLLPTFRQFVAEALANGGCVLVHGLTGISRSAALIIGYLMETEQLSYDEAFRAIQIKRFCVFPNVGFVQQLQEYHFILQASRVMYSRSQFEGGNRISSKRQLDEEMYGDDQWNSLAPS